MSRDKGPRCPSCQSHMQVLFADQVELDVCAWCGGVWLDGGELRAVAGRPMTPRVRRASTRACPRCAQAMDEASIDGDGHEVETCAECRGVFLDKARLEALVGEPLALSAKGPAGAEPQAQARLAPRLSEFVCPRCGQRKAWDDGYATPEGRLCDGCANLPGRPPEERPGSAARKRGQEARPGRAARQTAADIGWWHGGHGLIDLIFGLFR
ncbi:MAG: zf-TFIIB domain-containing protein [Myxococcales bacterium]|jgi:Zn-finger nucleic acid-binding protein